MDFLCFHSPFYKMVQKAYFKLARVEEPSISDKNCFSRFMEKVHPTLHIPQRTGNIYTGSLFSCLISLLVLNPNIKNKHVLLFSYGSGCCSTMMTAKINSNPLIKNNFILERLSQRIKISPEEYTKIMLQK